MLLVSESTGRLRRRPGPGPGSGRGRPRTRTPSRNRSASSAAQLPVALAARAAEGVQQGGPVHRRLVRVPLHLAQRDRTLGDACRRRTGPSRRSPSSPGWPGRARWRRGTPGSRRRRRRRTRPSSAARPPASAAAPRPRRRAPRRARRRAAGRSTAGWRRWCRSTAAAGRCRRARTPPRRSSCGILPGSSALSTSTLVPASRARTRSVPIAYAGSTGSSIRAVHSESRPNRVRYHGEPAAKKTSSGCRRWSSAGR